MQIQKKNIYKMTNVELLQAEKGAGTETLSLN